MKRSVRITASLGLICVMLLSVLSLTSCAGQPPELEPIKERLVWLIEESKELNVIYFGVGLPVYRRDTPLADRLTVYMIDELRSYDRVREESDYPTIEAIKEATARVYSEEYRTALYETAFEGVITGNTSAYMRFYDNTEWLFQNTSIANFTLEERIYDYSTMQIQEPSEGEYINVSVESYSIANGERETVYLSFVYENDNWYLNSPTY